MASCSRDPKVKILSGPDVLYSSDSADIEIIWETNVPARSIVEYGLSEDLGLDTVLTEERELHQVPMLFITADTLYFFRVRNRSDHFDGNPKSDVFSFRTDNWRQILTAPLYSEKGWNAFRAGDLNRALRNFQLALSRQPYYKTALIGLGWTYLMMPEREEDAYEHFNEAVLRYADAWDAYAGRAFLYTRREQYMKVIEDLTKLLQTDEDYSSDKIPDLVNSPGLRSLLANAYYNRGFFNEALSQCTVLKPDHGIDENDAATWQVNGSSYNSYLEALQALIMSLMTENGLI